MVGYRKNADLFTDHRIDDAKGKAPRDESTSAMAPDRPEARVLQEKTHGVLELREERL